MSHPTKNMESEATLTTAKLPISVVAQLMREQMGGAGASGIIAAGPGAAHQPPTPPEAARKRRTRRTVNHDYQPQFKGYQLVGDSMLGRVAGGIRRMEYNPKLKAKHLGLCVSGQTSAQLLRLLKERWHPKLGKKIVLTIGTNNIMKKVSLDQTATSIRSVIQTLLDQGAVKILLTTVPPIPRANDEQKAQIALLNENIKSIPPTTSITIVDLDGTFKETDGTIKNNLFEADGIHFNHEGITAFKTKMEPLLI